MNEDSYLDAMYEDRTELPDPPDESYDGGGWPGDGSGTDDLADFNANEAADYGPDTDDPYYDADVYSD